MTKKLMIAFALLIAATHVPAQAIEIKEVNKTVVSTLQILFGAAIATKGLVVLRDTAIAALAVSVNGDRGMQGFILAGYGVYSTALIAGGARLMYAGYEGLTEEEESVKG